MAHAPLRTDDASFLRLTGGGATARRFLVTGAAGFIGSHLCDRLLADGHWVYGVDSFDPYYDAQTKRANIAVAARDPRFRLAHRNLATDPVDDLVEWCDGVFHLAGQPGVRPSWGATFDRYTTNNLLVTQRLLDALVRAPRPFVQASSSSVYGHRERERLSEDEPLMPASPYGLSKMACEHLARVYAQQHGLRTVSLRYFTVYGPRQRPDMAFSRFIAAALAGQPLSLFGSGRQTRDFTFVGDVVDATVRAMGGDAAAYNIGGGSPTSIARVLRLLAEQLDCDLTTLRSPKADGDVAHTWADTTRIRAELGWVPRTRLADGLARQIASLRPDGAAGEVAV